MSSDPKGPGGPGRRRVASGYEPTEIAGESRELEGFVSGEYSDIATQIVGKRPGSGRHFAANRDVTMPSADPPSARAAAVPVRGSEPSIPGLQPLRTLGGQDVIDGRYRILDLIARGSMSRVYLAEHISIGRPVALKVINRDLVGEADAVQRFMQEARVLARVSHRNIVTLYDIGETAAGDPYIVMEYIQGASLAAIIKAKERLDPTRSVGVLLQIARGLSTVHDAGIIHRDLKPSNILVVRGDDGAIRAKIADFGLAKVTQDRGKGEFLTRAGAILGTPEYMAPEQVKGGEVDVRVDLYSLGCMAYEMLTGAPPFVGQEMATLYKQLHEVPKAFSEAAPDADIPEGVERVVRRALQKDPEERFSTALELYKALQEAAVEAGMSRRELYLDDSLMEGSELGGTGAHGSTMTVPSGRSRRGILGLAFATVAVIALVAGVAVGRFVARPAGAGGAALSAPAAEATGFVVQTVPAQAMVSVDGSEPRRAPATFSGLEPGEHTIAVERTGFVPRTMKVTATAGVTGVVEVALERPLYKSKIRSEPEGAIVEVDGEEIGPAPVEVELTDGEFHEITVHRPGFQTSTLFLGVGERVEEVTAVLRPALLEYGTIFVDSDSPARVLIDGVDTGEWTPTGEIQVSPGRHEITLVEGVGTKRSRRFKIGVQDVERLHF